MCKAGVKVHRSNNVARGPLPKFTAGPLQFKADHEEWFVSTYGSEEPSQNIPIDLHHYGALCKTIGCRTTKRGLTGGRLTPTQGRAIPPIAASSSAPLTMQDLATFMARQQMSFGMAGLPNFQLNFAGCKARVISKEMLPDNVRRSETTSRGSDGVQQWRFARS